MTALTAVAGASMAFPAIADKAANQRDSAVWQAKAEAFQQAKISNVSDNADSLTHWHTNNAIKAPFMRDVATTNDLLGVQAEIFTAAKFNAQEYRCLSEAVYYEARSEAISGQKAVAEVVLNRVTSKHYPNTVCGVVYQGAERITGCQFSFTCDGSILTEPKGKSWQRSQDVAALILTRGVKPFTGRATHYHTVKVNPKWSGHLKFSKQIGSHKFYRFKFRERPVSSASVSVAPPT